MRCRVSAIENPHIYGSGSKYISLGKLLHALDLIGEDGQDTMTMSTALFLFFSNYTIETLTTHAYSSL
jgi:hypothetical protein